MLATFCSGLSFGTGFPLQVAEDQIKVLISGAHSRRLWPLPLCAQLSIMRPSNGLRLSTVKEVEKKRIGLEVDGSFPRQSASLSECWVQYSLGCFLLPLASVRQVESTQNRLKYLPPFLEG